MTILISLEAASVTLHKLDLRPTPFSLIKTGKKKFELRLYDKRRRGILPGDVIEFTDQISGEKLAVDVVSLHIFNDFKQLYQSLDPLTLGYEVGEDVSYKDMEQYYPQERQRAYKVVAIKITLKD